MTSSSSNNIYIKDKSVAEQTNTNSSKKERVRQRKTSYTSNNYNSIIKRLRQLRTHILNFRVNDEELEIIIELMEKTGAKSISQVLRDSLLVYHGLLSGANNIKANRIVIQNPVVNLVRQEAKAEARVEIPRDIVRLVERLYHLSMDNPRMPPLQRDLIKQLYNKILKAVN